MKESQSHGEFLRKLLEFAKNKGVAVTPPKGSEK